MTFPGESASDWLKQISVVAQLIRSARSGQ